MKRAICVAAAAASCVCASALARGDEAVIGGPALAPVWEAASNGGRVDVVCIGDSNQLYFGTGWDEGWARALHEQFGLYATGLHSAGESNGVNSGVGWTWGTTATVGTSFTHSGAPAAAAALLNNPPSGLVPLNYLHVAEGNQATWQSASGMWLGAES